MREGSPSWPRTCEPHCSPYAGSHATRNLLSSALSRGFPAARPALSHDIVSAVSPRAPGLHVHCPPPLPQAQPRPDALADSPLSLDSGLPGFHCVAPAAARPEEPPPLGSGNAHSPSPFRGRAGCHRLVDHAWPPSPATGTGRWRCCRWRQWGCPDPRLPLPAPRPRQAGIKELPVNRHFSKEDTSPDGQKTHENVLHITRYQGHTDQSHNEIPPHSSQNG